MTSRPTLTDRAVALLEVIICSDLPTQLALAATFNALGYRQSRSDGVLSLGYVVTLSLVDAVLLIGLIVMFLAAHGESPRRMFLGSRALAHEVRSGLALSFLALAMTFAAMTTIRLLAPWLHTVERNPLQDLVRRPGDAVLLALVLVVGGAVREEIQRAFLLRRFEKSLGGRAVGVVVASVGFGAGHFIQGADVAIATGLLGVFWAIVYLRRGSVVAPLVSHSVFNLLQLGLFLISGR